MKYGKKTKGTVPVYGPDAKNVAKLQPVKPVGPGADKKDVKEDLSNVTVKPITGAQEVDVNGQKIATTTDATAAATIAQLAKDGKISAPTGTDSSNPLEEEPVPQIPRPDHTNTLKLGPVKDGKPTLSDGDPLAVTKSGKEIDSIVANVEITQNNNRLGYLIVNGIQYIVINVGHEWRVGPRAYKAIMSNFDPRARSTNVPSAPPMKEADDELLEKMRTIAGLR